MLAKCITVFVFLHIAAHWYFWVNYLTMAIIHNISSAVMFSYELENVRLRGAEKTTAFSIAVAGNVVFTALLDPDEKGDIVLYGVRKLLETYITDIYSYFTFSIDDDTISVAVFKTSQLISETATQFLPSFFLTPIMTSKETKRGRYETLSFYTDSACKVYVLAYYYTNRNVVSNEIELKNSDDISLNDINILDVSSGRFFDNTIGELISYTVVAGERKFEFIINETLPEADPAIIFRNSFGAWETFYLTGTKEVTGEIKRSLAYIDGTYKLYDLEEIESYKANSGVLLGGMLQLGRDLGRSKDVFLLDAEGNATYEIVIIDSELKYTNDDDALPTFDYTYRKTSMLTAMLETVRPPKLFDKTFDITFD